MCGFAGIVDFAGREVPAAALRDAARALAHRGPDAVGEVFCPLPDGATAGLVHRRLSVLDLSDAARQPMGAWARPEQPPALCKPWQVADADLALVYNGEIYNYRELREDLTRQIGFERHSASDSEILLAGLSQWGPDFLSRLQGMWSFAVLDRRPVEPSGRLPVLLGRDRFGKKPLLWTWQDRRLLFASEMRALLLLRRACGAPPGLDLSAVEHLLSLGFTLDPITIFSGVHSLPAGCLLTADAKGPQVRRWYAPPSFASPPIGPETPGNPASEMKQALESAVRERLIADVPVGAFLSGGVDSSIVVYHLTRLAGTVSTFHIGFPDQPRFDETLPAQAVARHFGTRHTSFPVHSRDLQDLIPRVLDHLAEPFADSSLLPTWILSQMTRPHVTVALSGDGGDELFGGYQRNRAYLAQRRLLARLGAGLLSLWPQGKPNAWSNLARQARQFRRGLQEADPVRRHLAWIGAEYPVNLLTPQAHAAIQAADPQYSVWSLYQSAAAQQHPAKPILAAPPVDPPGQTAQPETQTSRLALALDLDFSMGLPNDMLKKVDLAAMAHGLEVRCPFLDTRVVAAARRIPVNELLPHDRLKGWLIDLYRDVLPRRVWNRPKQGFELPIGLWLSGPLRPFFWDTVSVANVAKLGLFHRPAIECLMNEQAGGRREHGRLLWTLLMLHGWAERWL